MVVYLLQLSAWIVFMAALILGPAGTLAYPAGWVLIALFAASGLATILWLSRCSPELLRERMAPPIQRGQEGWDRVWLTLFVVAFCGWLAFMGWDAARMGFAGVPIWLQSLGCAGVLLYGLGAAWTFRENAFAAPVVKIQQGQKVIDTGPYALVRHPMYTSALALFFGTPLLLGSWWGLLVSAALTLALAWRAVREEGVLRKQFADYEAYSRRVRYRFLPSVW